MQTSLRKKVMAAGVAAVVAVSIYFIGYRRYVANMAVGAIEQRTVALFDLDDERRARGARSNIDLLRRLRTGSPDDQRLAIAEAANNLALQRYAEAQARYREALTWGRRPEIYLNLATAQAASGDREGAIRSLIEVIRLNPFMLSGTTLAELREVALTRYTATVPAEMRAEVYLNLAMGYLADGYDREAAEAAATAALYDPKIFTRYAELTTWSIVPVYNAMQRYRTLKKEREIAPPH